MAEQKTQSKTSEDVEAQAKKKSALEELSENFDADIVLAPE